MAESPKRLPATIKTSSPEGDAEEPPVVIIGEAKYRHWQERSEYYTEHRLTMSSEVSEALIIPAIEATKREKERTLQEKERTEQSKLLTARHKLLTARHFITGGVGVIALGVCALVPNVALYAAAIAAGVAGVLLLDQVVSKRKIPPRPKLPEDEFDD